MRKDGQRDAAAEVSKARRPTLAAWAVNQLPAPGVQALLDAGAALRKAQQRALSGIRAAELRGAADRRREAVDALTENAAQLLRDAGHAVGPHLGAIRETLLAASTGVEVGEQVARGRLAKEVPPPSGLDDVTGFETVADDDRPSQEREVAEAQNAVEAIRRQLRDAEAEVARLGREADETRASAEAARRHAEQAVRHADDAQRRARNAEADLARACAVAERLNQRLDAARQRLDTLTQR